ncbi:MULTISPECIES: response regulator [Aeromicrobium]|uniref:response regulator n=1 Tax=Aeromicrobium TaxID=2040 RepID=UPI0009E98C01|nr:MULTISPECIES: response regulator [Aeromicrobium]MCL8253046.1 response regulator [Aeromicrobium fastidiosum]
MPRVLVVDDTASIRFLIRTNLELAGYDVDEAVDGVDCLDVLKRLDTMPDLITVDVMMPRLDGVATVTAIRADPRTRDIAVVMVSTQGQAADIQRATEAGVDAYVTKPFDPDHLVVTVGDVLDRTRARRAP